MPTWLLRARQRLREAWTSVQVELQGSYSAERLRQLEGYMNTISSIRLLLVCLLTPLPCLLLSLAKELPPLAPPEAGVYNNEVFFFRGWAVLCFLGVCTLLQMGHGAPRLKLTNWQITGVSLLAATVSIAIIFCLCALTTFPLPFGLLVAGPPFVIVIAACFTYISRPRWRAEPSLFIEVKRQLVVYQCQTTLPFIYPMYILGFVSLTGWNQVLFVLVLPIIQIITKNWISRALEEDHDQKPQCVVLVVEVYNALYISNVLQSASSWASTAAVMAVDIIQLWVSMIDIVKVLDEVNALMAKIPRDHPMAKKTFVQVAVSLMDCESQQTSHKNIHSAEGPSAALLTRTKPSESAIGSKSNGPEVSREPDLDTKLKKGKPRRKWLRSQTTKVIPLQPTSQHKGHPTTETQEMGPSLGLEQVFAPQERTQFIQKISHVLFITEYLVLVEYIEVVLPFVYCLHQFALFHMHNSAYYSSLRGLSMEQFSSKLQNTLLYSSLELASFILLVIVLKLKLGFPSLQQLAFLLDNHAGVVQTKLNLIFVYIMQVSLEHLGADFSFKFSWLNHTKP